MKRRRSKCVNLGGSLGGLLDQTGNGRRQLGAVLLPVGQAIVASSGCFGIPRPPDCRTDALDETAVAAVARVGGDDVVERTLLEPPRARRITTIVFSDQKGEIIARNHDKNNF